MVKQPPAMAGLSPGKMGLIVILSVVLLVVIVVQFGGGSKRQASRPRRAQQAEQAENPETEKVAKVEDSGGDRVWPIFTARDVLAHNPFALPGELRPAEQDDVQLGANVAVVTPDEGAIRDRQFEFIASLRAHGVDMVLMTPGGSVARVGQSSFRLGDVVEGLVVTEISQGGIVFEHEPVSPEIGAAESKSMDLNTAQP